MFQPAQSCTRRFPVVLWGVACLGLMSAEADARRSANPENRIVREAVVVPEALPAPAPQGPSAGVLLRGGGTPVSLPAGAELITETTYDLQDMGSLGNRIVRTPAGEIHVTFVDDFCELDAGGCPPDLNAPNPFPERANGYAVRSIGGSWSTPAKVEDTSIHGCCVTEPFGGYGAMDMTPDGRVAVAQHINEDGCDPRATTYTQDFIGAGTYTAYLSPITNPSFLFPQVNAYADGSFLMLGEIARFGSYDETQEFRVAYLPSEGTPFVCPVGWQYGTWATVVDTTLFETNTPAFPALARGADGRGGIAVGDFGGNVRLIESSDGTFAPGTITLTQITSYTNAAVTAPDSTSNEWRSYIHCDLAYDGTTPHIVWSEMQARRDSLGVFLVDYRSRILHWTPANGPSVVKQVAPGEADTFDQVDTGGSGPIGGFNTISVDWPQVGFRPGGEVVVAWIRFVDAEVDPTADAGLPGIVTGIGYGDICAAVSTGPGSWSSATNLTNTPNADERFVSIADRSAAGKVNLVFQASATNEAGVTAIGDRGLGTELWTRRVAYLEADLPSPAVSAPNLAELSEEDTLVAHPNPSRSSVDFVVPQDWPAEAGDLRIFGVDGRLVASIPVNGARTLRWDGRTAEGPAPAGVYFAELRGEERTVRTKLLRLR